MLARPGLPTDVSSLEQAALISRMRTTASKPMMQTLPLLKFIPTPPYGKIEVATSITLACVS